MPSIKTGITRLDAEVLGDVLLSPVGAVITSGIISSTARDTGSTPTTYLRAGLVLSKLSSGLLKQFGANLSTVTNESVGTGDGSTKTFDLEYEHVVPFSEIITVAGTPVERGTDYTIDYALGQITFKTAPSNAAVIKATYAHIKKDGTHGYVTDGTEVPYAVLLDPVDLLDENGIVTNKSARILLGGIIKENALIVNTPGAEEYAKNYLSDHGFFGIPVQEY